MVVSLHFMPTGTLGNPSCGTVFLCCNKCSGARDFADLPIWYPHYDNLASFSARAYYCDTNVTRTLNLLVDGANPTLSNSRAQPPFVVPLSITIFIKWCTPHSFCKTRIQCSTIHIHYFPYLVHLFIVCYTMTRQLRPSFCTQQAIHPYLVAIAAFRHRTRSCF